MILSQSGDQSGDHCDLIKLAKYTIQRHTYLKLDTYLNIKINNQGKTLHV